MKRLALLTIALLAALPLPAPAETIATVVSTDAAGDANFANNQSQETVPDPNQSTAPASIDSADIREIGLETLYATEKDRDANGAVVRVRYVPTALRVSFKTTAPAKPTFGPGIIFRMSANVGDAGCQVQFELWVPGSAPNTSTAQHAAINRLRNCPGGTGFLTSGFTVGFDGTSSLATFPFAATQGMLADDVTLAAYTRPHSRVVLATSSQYVATAPAIDQAPQIQTFGIGQDVPPDVDCVASPSNPACA